MAGLVRRPVCTPFQRNENSYYDDIVACNKGNNGNSFDFRTKSGSVHFCVCGMMTMKEDGC